MDFREGIPGAFCSVDAKFAIHPFDGERVIDQLKECYQSSVPKKELLLSRISCVSTGLVAITKRSNSAELIASSLVGLSDAEFNLLFQWPAGILRMPVTRRLRRRAIPFIY